LHELLDVPLPGVILKKRRKKNNLKKEERFTTINQQNCKDCPHRPASKYKAAPFEKDLAMRSLEYAVVRFGIDFLKDPPEVPKKRSIPLTPMEIEVQVLMHRGLTVRNHARVRVTEEPIPRVYEPGPCAAVIARERTPIIDADEQNRFSLRRL
jgi:hypothetical protein